MVETANVPEPMKQMADRMYAAAQPGAVYSEAVHAGSYTVITASEVTAGGGFGFGQGQGPVIAGKESEGAPHGGGGGGGGGSMGRPVAVISIGPDGVAVKPVVDITKVGLAVLTAWGTVAVGAIRLRRRRRSR
ncbi:MAG: hypothetical protein J2P45_20360 [Candidatus Dormibacteraeota bacterium]|nr:hypothetical protein [Candidatus Dormibacteraeota bacterium]